MVGVSSHAPLDSAAAAAEFADERSAGIRSVRRDLPWSKVETAPGQWNWEGWDGMLRAAEAAGVAVMPLLVYGNPWAFDPPWWCRASIDDKFPPSDPDDFGNFAFEAASRLYPAVNAFEVWNEPNVAGRFWKDCLWPLSPARPGAYVRLLTAASEGIRSAAPGAQVVLGGTYGPDTAVYPGTLRFLEACYRLDPELGEQFDVLAIHPYDRPLTWSPPEASGPLSPSLPEAITRTRALLTEHGDGDKPIWITEHGFPSGGPGGVGELNQARYLVRSILLSAQANVERYFVYTYADGRDPDTQEGSFGLVGNADAGHPHKAAFGALETMLSVLGPTRYEGDIDTVSPSSGRALAFEGPRRSVISAWTWRPGSTGTVALELEPHARVRRISMDGASRTTLQADGNGLLSVPIDPDPVYLVYRSTR